MSKRRLTLHRETVSELKSEDLATVIGAISAPHMVCVITDVTSVAYSRCHTCGIACTADCPQTS